jgi:hypothetical protein
MSSDLNHQSRAHALLSPSGASKWMNCTPSARLEEAFKNETSIYAEEGTLAHELAEINLLYTLERMDAKNFFAAKKEIQKNALYQKEMEEHVSTYSEYVIQEFIAASQTKSGAVFLTEQVVDLTYFIEEGFGSCDAIIIADGTMEVIDLKYGKGVKVSAENNSQTMLYGLGAFRKYELLFDIHKVKMTIVQPRLDAISSWEIEAKDLVLWGEERVRPKAQQAYNGDGEQIPGEWCRFCRVKPRCAALHKKSLEIARHEFSEPKLLTDEDLVEVLKQSSIIENWLSGVAEYMFKQALEGKKWDGFKLVEGRSNRIWTDQKEVEKVLEKNNFKKDDFMISKLAGITEIEKLIGKKQFPVILDGLVVKPEGKPTLVPSDDKRPEFGLDQAKTDFA